MKILKLYEFAEVAQQLQTKTEMEEQYKRMAAPSELKMEKDVNMFIEDVFKLVEKSKRGRMAHLYYCYPVKMNKNGFVGGVKQVNPYSGITLYKCTDYTFHFGESYGRAVLKRDPDYVFSQRRENDVERIQGYKMLEWAKGGKLKFRMANFDVYGEPLYYMVNMEGEIEQVDEEKVLPYLGVSAPAPLVNFRSLPLDRVYRISCDKNIWINKYFEFPEMVPYIRKNKTVSDNTGI